MKRSKEEKVIRLLQYLKQYTDCHNPTSISRIDKYFKENYEENFFGDTHTRQKMIQEMVRVMNSDGHGNILPKEEWKVIYDDFTTIYDEGKDLGKRHQIVNLYYNQEFKNYEINDLIDSVKANDGLSREEKENLLGKIDRFLKNEYYGTRGMSPAERTTKERFARERKGRIDEIVRRKLAQKDWW